MWNSKIKNKRKIILVTIVTVGRYYLNQSTCWKCWSKCCIRDYFGSLRLWLDSTSTWSTSSSVTGKEKESLTTNRQFHLEISCRFYLKGRRLVCTLNNQPIVCTKYSIVYAKNVFIFAFFICLCLFVIFKILRLCLFCMLTLIFFFCIVFIFVVLQKFCSFDLFLNLLFVVSSILFTLIISWNLYYF